MFTEPSMLSPKHEMLAWQMQSLRCDGPVTEKKWRGQKVVCAHCQERGHCAIAALCEALLLAAPRSHSVLLFQKIRGLFDSSMRLWERYFRGLPSLGSFWVKAAKAEDGSQPSRQSNRTAAGQGLTNDLRGTLVKCNTFVYSRTTLRSLSLEYLEHRSWTI